MSTGVENSEQAALRGSQEQIATSDDLAAIDADYQTHCAECFMGMPEHCASGVAVGARRGAARMSGRGTSKYGATRAPCGDHTHPSQLERRWCWLLQQYAQTGEIRHLRRQTRWPLVVNGQQVGVYTSDFDFEELRPDGSWAFVVADAKGVRVRDWSRTVKLMHALYGWTIRELH